MLTLSSLSHWLQLGLQDTICLTESFVTSKLRDISQGYFSLNDFWHSDASRAWRSKTPTMFYTLKKARNSRDSNYSFEVYLMHAVHAWKSLSEK